MSKFVSRKQYIVEVFHEKDDDGNDVIQRSISVKHLDSQDNVYCDMSKYLHPDAPTLDTHLSVTAAGKIEQLGFEDVEDA